MWIRFNTDLTEQSFHAIGEELFSHLGFRKNTDIAWGDPYNETLESFHRDISTIKNPVLMTDMERLNEIEDVTKRLTLRALLNNPKRRISYDSGTSLTFDQEKYGDLWGPSIDTLLVCKALFNHIDLSKVKTSLEPGCGSSFITKHIIENSELDIKAYAIDFNHNAYQCALDNMGKYIKDGRCNIVIGDAFDYMKGRSVDLLVCNPPYIPRPKCIEDNAYEGLSLLVYMLENAGKLLTDNGVMLINKSNLGDNIINEVINRKYKHIDVTVLEEMEVPLKIYNILNDKEWMDYLITECGLKKQYKNGYEYWQKLSVLKITRRV